MNNKLQNQHLVLKLFISFHSSRYYMFSQNFLNMDRLCD